MVIAEVDGQRLQFSPQRSMAVYRRNRPLFVKRQLTINATKANDSLDAKRRSDFQKSGDIPFNVKMGLVPDKKYHAPAAITGIIDFIARNLEHFRETVVKLDNWPDQIVGPWDLE